MRTTLTLEPDVAQLLKEAMRKTNMTLKEAVNTALRNGLREKEKVKKKPFKVFGKSLKMKPEFVGLSVNEILDIVEGPWRR
jgi:hypothetical protein